MYIHRYKPYNGDVTQGEPFDQAFMGYVWGVWSQGYHRI